MTKVTRWGVSALLILGGIALGGFVGCSSDDDQPGPVPETDSGVEPDTGTPETESDTGEPDTTPADTATDADTSTPAALKVNLVHAAGGFGAVRLCIWNDLTKSFTPLAKQLPESDEGLPYGGGGPLPVAGGTLAVLPTVAITAYLVPASTPKDTECGTLIPGSGTEPPEPPSESGIVKLNTVAKGAFATGKSYVVVVLGCPAGEGTDDAAKAKCGAAYDDTSNARIAVIEVNGAAPAEADQVNTQFLHLSPWVQAQASSGVWAGFTVPASGGGDAGTEDAGEDAGDDETGGSSEPIIKEIGGPASYPADNTSAPVPVPATAKALDGLFTDKAATRFQAWAGGFGTTPLLGDGVPFAMIETVSPAAGSLQNGRAYTFVAVGDPTVTPPGATFFRIVALDTTL